MTPNTITTATDMAIIADAAMQNPVFRRMVGTSTYPWHSAGWDTVLVTTINCWTVMRAAPGCEKRVYRRIGAQHLSGFGYQGQRSFLTVLLQGDVNLHL
jgi:hypothetical protein